MYSRLQNRLPLSSALEFLFLPVCQVGDSLANFSAKSPIQGIVLEFSDLQPEIQRCGR